MSAVLDPGPRPELAWLPVERLSVDPRYQRDTTSARSRKHIGRIAANFRWSRFQAVLVTQADKGWLIIDGQHRVEAAKERGFDLVPAVVISQAGLAEQAASFAWANDARIAVSAQALFHARLLAGDADSQLVAAVCAKYNVVIERHNKAANQLAPRHTAAVPALLRILRRNGEPMLSQVVSILADSWGDQGGALRAPFFGAIALYLSEGGDEASLRAALPLNDWRELEAAGKLHGGGDWGPARAMLEVLYRWLKVASGGVKPPGGMALAERRSAPISPTPPAGRKGGDSGPLQPSRSSVAAPAHRPIRAAKPTQPKIVTPDQTAIDKFIAEKGVTKLPGVGSPEAATIAPLEWDRKKGKFTRGASA